MKSLARFGKLMTFFGKIYYSIAKVSGTVNELSDNSAREKYSLNIALMNT